MRGTDHNYDIFGGFTEFTPSLFDCDISDDVQAALKLKKDQRKLQMARRKASLNKLSD